VPAVRFSRRFTPGSSEISRIGPGEIGGKAAGLVQVRDAVLEELRERVFPGLTLGVPAFTVIATGVFDAFMRRNDLYQAVEAGLPDQRVAHAFLRAELPAELVGDLRGLVEQVRTPLAVRSSSLLEDALAHPFAGVYATKMIPNDQVDTDTRFRKLVEAVKFVYSSTFFRAAREYQHSMGVGLRDEKMAVVVQEVVGKRRGSRFYPTLSGVARSYNYYPSGRARPEEGVVNLALGLGKTIVDGGVSWAFSPAHPKVPPPFNSVQDLLKNTQTSFWAIDMAGARPYHPLREAEFLHAGTLREAEDDETLTFLASTYDVCSDRLTPGLQEAGPRVLDFSPLLVHHHVPLSACLRALLAAAEGVMGGAAEIEFAVNLDRHRGVPAWLGVVQLRPMAVSTEAVHVKREDLDAPAVVVASEHAMGNGVLRLEDVVFLKPEVFTAASTKAMASELEGLNRSLAAEGRRYLLIGFGRWGSSDPWLGVPVVWGQISGARAIVEATMQKMNPELSQGSHFFHNLIGFQIPYLSVQHTGAGSIDWAWLESQETIRETAFVRHIRARVPLVIRVDGRSGRGVVLRDG
jgi:hypothetical protein